MKILFLEDSLDRMKTIRQAHPNDICVMADTNHIGLLMLQMTLVNGVPYDMVSLDHDLFGRDAMPFVDWLVENKVPIPVQIHSMNPVGAERMQKALERAGYNVTRRIY